jgi:hypothetical protein
MWCLGKQCFAQFADEKSGPRGIGCERNIEQIVLFLSIYSLDSNKAIFSKLRTQPNNDFSSARGQYKTLCFSKHSVFVVSKEIASDKVAIKL